MAGNSIDSYARASALFHQTIISALAIIPQTHQEAFFVSLKDCVDRASHPDFGLDDLGRAQLKALYLSFVEQRDQSPL